MKILKTLTTPDGNIYAIPDKVTLDGNILNFWKTIDPPEAEDTFLYSVDLSSLNVSIEFDNTLTESGKAADAKVVGDRFSQLSEEIGKQTGTGLSTEAIDKLEEVGNYLAYTTADGGLKWTELISILRNGSSGGGSGETEKTLTSISATYTGGDVTEGTALSDLTGITVIAHYSDCTNENVTGYTLSGTISEGSNTITVTYNGKTTTFTVTGSAIGGAIDTNPRIIQTDAGYGTDNGNIVEKVGMSATEKYLVPGNSNITYYIENTDNIGSTSICNKAVVWNGEDYVSYYSTTFNQLKEYTNGFKTTTGDRIAFSIPTAGISNSYAYVHQTGDIIFAGEDTQYFGKRNISEV